MTVTDLSFGEWLIFIVVGWEIAIFGLMLMDWVRFK